MFNGYYVFITLNFINKLLTTKSCARHVLVYKTMKNTTNFINHPSNSITVLNTGVFFTCTRSIKLNVFKLWYLTSKDVKLDQFEEYPQFMEFPGREANIIRLGNKCFLQTKRFIPFNQLLSIELESKNLYKYLDDIIFNMSRELDSFAKTLLLTGNKREIEQYIESLESLHSEGLPY